MVPRVPGSKPEPEAAGTWTFSFEARACSFELCPYLAKHAAGYVTFAGGIFHWKFLELFGDWGVFEASLSSQLEVYL